MSYVRVLSKHVPLDNTYENVITFKDLKNSSGTLIKTHLTKSAYFSSYDSHFGDISYYIKKNFRYGDTLTTSIRFIDKELGSNVVSGLNYLHVINDDNPRYPNDLFYFITDTIYLSGNVIQFNLELDIFTTYFEYLRLDTNNRDIYCKRVHCDRYNNYQGSFGCAESMLPDLLDNKYKGTILKSHDRVFQNYKWIIVYLANNTPRARASQTTHATASGGINLKAGESASQAPFVTRVNGYPAPFMVGVIPIDTSRLYYSAWISNNKSYGINENLEGETSYYSLLANSPYVLSMQFSTFDFSSYLNLDDNSILASGNTISQPIGFRPPIVVLKDITTKSQIFNSTHIALYKKVSSGTNTEFTKDYMRRQTKRDIMLEPKLYTAPYTNYSFTSACEKETAFEPMLNGIYQQTISFIKTFTPSPSGNAEMTFLNDGIYKYYQDNYNGSSAIINTELPIVNNNYQTFLANQKNSFYTGVGLSVASSLASGIGSTITAGANNEPIPFNAVSSSIFGIASAITQSTSKIKDLQNAPNKIAGNNFDIYSIISNTTLDKFINVWTLSSVETKQVSDFYYLYGYEVDMFRECNMEGNYVTANEKSCITRQLFNYLCIDENITDTLFYNKNGKYPLSNEVRTKFNDLFNRGVRLWFIDNISEFKDFSLENKEIN